MSERRPRLRHLGREVLLGKEEFTIGRSSECHLALDDLLVSRQHAIIRLRGEEAEIDDLGSRNGVLINGKPTRGRTPLRHGDRITIGSNDLYYLSMGSAREEKETQAIPREVIQEGLLREAEPTERKSMLELLLLTAERRLEEEGDEEVENATSTVFITVRAELLRGQFVDPSVLDRLLDLGVHLAERTGKHGWLDRIIDVHAAAGRLVRADGLAKLKRSALKIGYRAGDTIQSYIDKIRAKGRILTAEEVQRLAALGTLGSQD